MHPKLRRLGLRPWPEQAEAVRLARHLRLQLAIIEKQIRRANGRSQEARDRVARRLVELEHAALELAGLGVAHADGRARRGAPRQGAILVLVVQKAAETFTAAHPLAARKLPNPDGDLDRPHRRRYPPSLIAAVRTHLDAALEIMPSLSNEIGTEYEGLVEGLVLAAAARCRAVAQGKSRSAYLDHVAHALCRAGLVKRTDVRRLKKQVERYL